MDNLSKIYFRAKEMNFKEQAGIVNNNSNFIGRFVSFCFEARTKTHIAHLQTTSYAEHKALNEFYDGIIPLVDAVAEAYQGKYGIISNYPDTYLSGSGVEVVSGLRTWIYENRKQICSDSNIQNEIDNVLSLCDTTIYKLKFLK